MSVELIWGHLFCILSTGGEDFVSLANYGFELTRSQPRECVKITITDDDELEREEKFLLVLKSEQNTSLNFKQQASTAVVVIVDNGK